MAYTDGTVRLPCDPRGRWLSFETLAFLAVSTGLLDANEVRCSIRLLSRSAPALSRQHPERQGAPSLAGPRCVRRGRPESGQELRPREPRDAAEVDRPDQGQLRRSE